MRQLHDRFPWSPPLSNIDRPPNKETVRMQNKAPDYSTANETPFPIMEGLTTFHEGPTLFGHTVAWNDYHRSLQIDNGPPLRFSSTDYKLVYLLLHYPTKISYSDIARDIFGCALDELLLREIYKRISSVRRKLLSHHIAIISMPRYGYTLREHNNSYSKDVAKQRR